MLGAGFWGVRGWKFCLRYMVLGFGCMVFGGWGPCVGSWVLGVGCWIFVLGCWILGLASGCWVLKTQDPRISTHKTWHPGSSTQDLPPKTQRTAPNTEQPVPGKHPIPKTQRLAPNTQTQAPKTQDIRHNAKPQPPNTLQQLPSPCSQEPVPDFNLHLGFGGLRGLALGAGLGSWVLWSWGVAVLGYSALTTQHQAPKN